jgi:phospholipase/carboxylesterase
VIESEKLIAGLRTIVVEPDRPPERIVVLLHGFRMMPEALSPFAHSLGVSARFLVPEAPLPAGDGRSWWSVDTELRSRALASGPRDLAALHPPDAADARRRLSEFMAEAATFNPGIPTALIGFSQGGMLACDAYLRGLLEIDCLGLLSASRIMLDEWQPRVSRIAGLPILVSHGRLDAELAFSAGQALRDFVQGAGARVTWVEFDDGHEIPLVVWRALRKFLGERRVTA